MSPENDTAASPYVYSELKDPEYDIRLVTILPGKDGSPMKLQIFHARLEPVLLGTQSNRTSREDLERNLPQGWRLGETLEGRYIFDRLDDETGDWEAAWSHPDPGLDSSSYTTEVKDDLVTSSVKFEALSYCWGREDPATQESVTIIDGPSDRSTLAVGRNLASALRHLRPEQQSRTLWIDAICLNQSDDDEKSKQVTRMADIYRLASHVVVWLGPARDNSDVAMRELQRVGSGIQFAKQGYFCPLPGNDPSLVLFAPFQHFTRTQWDAFETLFQRDWFGRLWIVQEVSLGAPRAVVVCGSMTIPWYVFCRAVIFLYNHTQPPSEEFRRRIAYTYALCCIFRGKNSLTSMLQLSKIRNCRYSQDKIYGLLGMMPDGLGSGIVPDYKSKSEKAYKDLILSGITYFSRLQFFRYCGARYAGAEWPSWSFKFPGEIKNAGDATRMAFDNQFSAHFSACDATYTAIRPSILSVVGVRVATLSHVTRAVDINHSKFKDEQGRSEACLDAVREWEPKDLYAAPPAPYVTGGTLLDAYSATLRVNLFRERYPQVHYYPTLSEWKAKTETSVNAFFGPKAHEGKKDILSMSESEQTALDYVAGRSLLRSHEGYIGLGPAEAQENDIACVFLGSGTPVIIRAEKAEGTFRVIGEAYVHGTGDGEALFCQKGLPEPWILERRADASGSFNDIQFFNMETGTRTAEDPRLDALPEDWKRVPARPKTAGDPDIFQEFQHRTTGEVRNSDPRLTPEALKRRGVKLETFSLV
ncbi:hypothetical protein diail_643 [Diaporthe ilicicola]|nr:hypothetical protein diail_643 [Diaporthe ilicicola]